MTNSIAGSPSEAQKTRVQVLDFFSGCGGMSYGFATADAESVEYEVKGALDIDRHANATYAKMVRIEPQTTDIRDIANEASIGQLCQLWQLDRHFRSSLSDALRVKDSALIERKMID